MADGLGYNEGTDKTVLTDDTGAGGHAQVVKLAYGADGNATQAQLDADGLLVNLGANNDVTTELPAAATLGSGDTPVAMPRVGALLRGTYYPSSTNTEFPIGLTAGNGDSVSPTVMQYFMTAASIGLIADDYDSVLHRVHTAHYIATLLSATGATSDQTSADQKNQFGFRGVILTIYVSAIAGGSITPLIQTYSGAHGGWVNLLEGTAITATGSYICVLQPGASATIPAYFTSGKVMDYTLPYFWRLYMDHSTADAASYSVTAQLTL